MPDDTELTDLHEIFQAILGRTLVLLARCFAWREALTIVQPVTLLRWHQNAFRLFSCLRSSLGRPRIPTELQRLIARMAEDNPTRGEERIAAELLLKLGLQLTPQEVEALLRVPRQALASFGARLDDRICRLHVDKSRGSGQ